MASTFLKPDDPTLPKEEMTWARRSHLTTLLTYPLALIPIPFSWIVPSVAVFPFAIWLSRKKSSYSAIQSLEAIYLQAILSFGYIGFGSAFSEDRVLLVFSYIFMTFLHMGLLLVSVIRVSYGKKNKYPFSFIPRLFQSRLKQRNWSHLKNQFQAKDEFLEFKSSMEKIDRMNERISSDIENIKDASIRTQARLVVDSLESLRASLVEKPENFKLSRQFLNYFPETTAELLEKYSKLETRSESMSASITSREKRRENLLQLLENIHHTSEDVRKKIYASESMALDVEINSMKKNIEYGGY